MIIINGSTKMNSYIVQTKMKHRFLTPRFVEKNKFNPVVLPLPYQSVFCRNQFSGK